MCGLRKCFESFTDKFFGCCFCNLKRKKIPNLAIDHSLLLDSAVELAEQIRKRTLRSEDLVKACIERIVEVNKIVNAVTDERYMQAMEEARAVDELIESGYMPKHKPFLGVPFTAKESHAVAGMLHTLGIKARKNIRADEDAECVRLMREAGAIPVAVTNVPEICKWIETRNMVFGQTRNPHHTGRTVGGSSGGEAALSACIASPISLCADTGGSTRMPAFFCGLYALNPTAGYTNTRGALLSDGKAHTMGSISFLSRHCQDLLPLVKVVAADKAEKLNLDRKVDILTLTYFYVETANDKRVSPICKDLRDVMTRAIDMLTQELNVKPEPYRHNGFNYMFKLWRYCMSKQALDFPMMLTNNRGNAKFFIELPKKLICLSDYTLGAILGLADKQVLPAVKKEWAEPILKDMREDLIELLGNNGVLLFPSAPYPAPHHYTSLLRPFNFAYWAIFNALEFPSAQVPTGLTASGLPLGIQVVAAPCNDALCVAVAEFIGNKFGGVHPPCKVPKKKKVSAKSSTTCASGQGSEAPPQPPQTSPSQSEPPQTSPLQTSPLQTSPPQTEPSQTEPSQTSPPQPSPQKDDQLTIKSRSSSHKCE